MHCENIELRGRLSEIFFFSEIFGGEFSTDVLEYCFTGERGVAEKVVPVWVYALHMTTNLVGMIVVNVLNFAGIIVKGNSIHKTKIY